MIKSSILIIGAGPAGLGMGARLRKAGIDFEMVEQSDKVANSWHNHYERLHLHTVRQLSNLPLVPYPDHYPLYVPRHQVVEYFEDYARKFELKPHFGEKVVSIKQQGGQWITKTHGGLTFSTDKAIVATGVNRVPNIPSWSGIQEFTGRVIHAKDYRNVEAFKGQRVLVVGMGNTGAELALDLSENDCKTYISVRGPVSIVPRDLNGRPVQLTAIQLAKLPFGIGDWLGNFIRTIYLGNLKKYGLETPKLSPTEQLRKTGKTPVVDIGTVDQIKAGKIHVCSEIDHFKKNSVVFKTGEEIKIDAVILATGYHARVQDFVENVEEHLNSDRLPKTAIVGEENDGLYFVGFDNYKMGGIFGIIREETERVLDHIVNSIGK